MRNDSEKVRVKTAFSPTFPISFQTFHTGKTKTCHACDAENKKGDSDRPGLLQGVTTLKLLCVALETILPLRFTPTNLDMPKHEEILFLEKKKVLILWVCYSSGISLSSLTCNRLTEDGTTGLLCRALFKLL